MALKDYMKRRRRELDNMTQAELAHRVGLARETVSSLERGRVLRPSAEVLRSLARALRDNEETLFFEAGYRTIPPSADTQDWRVQDILERLRAQPDEEVSRIHQVILAMTGGQPARDDSPVAR